MSDELISIQDFARRYSVDTETVRSWIKKKQIPYEYSADNRRIRKTDRIDKLSFISPVDPDEEPIV